MKIDFQVQWRKVLKSLSIYMSLAIIIPVCVMFFIRSAKLGFSYEKTFQHISPLAFSLIILGIIPFSIFFAFLISLYFRLAAVTVTEDDISGRNYWCIRKKIPLSDIIGLEKFSSNGINAIVVCSKKNGKIYISEHTENLKDLIELLATYIPKPENHGA